MADSPTKHDKAQARVASDDVSEKTQAGEVSSTSPTEPETIKLLAEELSVAQRQIETGRVRVRVATREREELVDMPLARERVVVNRVAVGRQVDTIPAIREEGTSTTGHSLPADAPSVRTPSAPATRQCEPPVRLLPPLTSRREKEGNSRGWPLVG
jgi:Domain of unknown function (DUF2382)